MVKAIITLGEYQDRILTIVKGKFGFKNKSDAVNFVIKKFEEAFLEPEVKPEFLKELKESEKEIGIPFKTMEELQVIIDNA